MVKELLKFWTFLKETRLQQLHSKNSGLAVLEARNFIQK